MNSFSKIWHRAINKPIDQKWEIGFLDVCIDDLLNGRPYDISVIQHHYTQGWFADPFVLDVTDDKIFLLVEEWHYADRRGRISKLTIDRKTYTLMEVKPILMLKSHLSFPYIKRDDDDIYIYPENARGDGLCSYKYNKKTGLFEKTGVILSEPLVDPVITNVLGSECIFATSLRNPNGSLLWYEIQNGVVRKKSDINFANETARNAGAWFIHAGEVYRPAQDCNKCYGGAIIMQKITMDNDTLRFNDVCRIESTNNRFKTGCHTLNQYKGVCVVDVHGYKYPTVARIWNVFNKNAR